MGRGWHSWFVSEPDDSEPDDSEPDEDAGIADQFDFAATDDSEPDDESIHVESPEAELPESAGLVGHRIARLAVSVAILAWLVGIVVWNMPNSATRNAVLPKVQPLMTATGIQQNWGVFAPNPRNEEWDMTIEMYYADGSMREWTFPDNQLVGMWFVFRWQKQMEALINENNTANAEAFAKWLRLTESSPDNAIVRVVFRHEYLIFAGPGQPFTEVWADRVPHTVELAND
jgi:hypothetical protein